MKDSATRKGVERFLVDFVTDDTAHLPPHRSHPPGGGIGDVIF